jgi:hypothetical protein
MLVGNIENKIVFEIQMITRKKEISIGMAPPKKDHPWNIMDALI